MVEIGLPAEEPVDLHHSLGPLELVRDLAGDQDARIDSHLDELPSTRPKREQFSSKNRQKLTSLWRKRQKLPFLALMVKSTC